MNKIKLILVIVLSTLALTNLKSQNNGSKIITDTTIVLGVISLDEFIGESLSNDCSCTLGKSIAAGSIVFISGAKRCISNSFHGIKYFYEAVYKGKTYYIEDGKVYIKDYTIDDIYNLSIEQAKKFKDHTDLIAGIYYSKSINEAMDFLKSCKSAGLVIYDWSFYDESEYTEGTSVKISVYNPTKNPIKYLWFSFVGYNPVGDKVIDRKSKTSVVTRKAVGPIAKDAIASYEFSYAWFTDIVETVKISTIKVQYMDGTMKVINNPKAITLSKKFRELLTDE